MLKRIFFVSIFVVFLFSGFNTKAAQLGDILNFYTEGFYDISGRTELSAELVKISPKIYFFVDKNWWDSQGSLRHSEIINSLESLSIEFENKIYPNLTSAFGSEWKPGIDGDEKITVLIHQMKDGVGGYFRTADEYLKIQYPESNEREMVYLTTAGVDSPEMKSFLAHEFLHLITFNQKERKYGISEETWLNEARAEYAPTFLGYDNIYSGSNLERRVKIFLEQPSDAITEWQNRKSDYGALNIFIQYLVDHYGVGILTDSLKSEKIGIASINEALLKNGFKEDFSQIFTDWTIAVFVNDCNLGTKYCYLNKNLEKLRVNPTINFLPLEGKSVLSITNVTKNWSGNWQKFIGGQGALKLEFKGLAGLNFKVPYLVQDKEGKYSVNFLALDKDQKGEIYIPEFNSKNLALIVIPSLQTKISGFDGLDPTYPYSVTVSVVERTPTQELELIQQLLNQITLLQKEIAKVRAQINAILGNNNNFCQKIENDLYFGLRNNLEVRCLQEFLKNQGSDIYPEGLITGYFGPLTKAAVIRFQEKYASEILEPLGLTKGTGRVAQMTRNKINELLGR
jgi:peptidoglycan hydrolase-like protein with peptidoglycan-binding domain